MKSLFTTFAALFAAPALIGLLAYLPPVQAADRVEEIRIAVPDVSAGSQPSGGGVVDVLRAQEIFEQEFAADGIKVQWSFFKGAGPVINEALANGQVDFAYLGDLAAIIGKANGLDTRLLSATARDIKHYLGVVPGSGIHTLADLKGKRVGIFRGTASQLSLDAALASQGLSERDLQVINLDFNAATAALAAKQIDATWGLSNLIALKARGVAELPLSTDDLGGVGSIQGVLVADGRFVDRHPEITARLVKAQQKAVTWLRDEHNKQAYIDLVSGLANYPTLILQNDLHNASFSKIFDPQLDAGFLGRLQQSVDLAAEQRLVRKGFVVADWAEPKFLDAALGERKAVAAAQ
ncbi:MULTISPECIES: ABC transporter substrate-binding protein [Pseudomonas]|uniref:ABC transporter substrate-binding protein n=1 Tax=Pseudomonas TaxID=286 RepID=UPI001C7E8C54|nr:MULTISPECIES: ABC transporter substrate-binding protein [Pseudomonas]MDG9928341.1 ABC transporter substrate-binding protein [Pseudomonas sp. GD04042]MDH0481095.1 ABC transporter substrate-binding protein [Pseudomonas sp. GD04015]MDH0604431.1 ABC transporter substrate-binding protein [Pseudomonas sp. GD03869]